MTHPVVQRWHRIVETGDLGDLSDILDENVVFHSPVVHTPQEGHRITLMYLTAAFGVLVNDSFHYVREVVGDNDAVLEFETEIDGIYVNGIDMIRWNSDGKLIDFKVMARPKKGLEILLMKMAARLEAARA